MGRQSGRLSRGPRGTRSAAGKPEPKFGSGDRRTVAEVESPRVHPPEFWEEPELRHALAERNFGYVLRAYRRAHTPALNQAQIGQWLGVTQGQISRIERGEAFDYPIAKLSQWATILGVPQHYLWFQHEPDPPDCSPESHDHFACSRGVQHTGHPTGEGILRRQFLKAAGAGAAGVGASLLGSTTPGPVLVNSHRSSTTSPEVDLLREMAGAFRRLDNKHGGAYSRSAVRKCLTTMVDPMLAETRVRQTMRSDLFAVAAELHQLAGWMAYDTDQSNAGRDHLSTALRLCRKSRNHALSAEILAGMSHQAAFRAAFHSTPNMAVPNIAVDLALAARQAAHHAGVPLLEAEAAAMEAHGLALDGDKEGSLAALCDAEKLFGVGTERELPEWLSYFDSAYLAAKFAHTFRDLGQPQDAEAFARQSLEMSDGYQRGRLFNTALLASILADLGRVDEACALGEQATHIATEVRSVRSLAYLADLARRLGRFAPNREVVDLYAQMVDAGIPVPAER